MHKSFDKKNEKVRVTVIGRKRFQLSSKPMMFNKNRKKTVKKRSRYLTNMEEDIRLMAANP